MFDGIVRVLKEVRYVPNLTRNLISLRVSDDYRYVKKIENGTMKICKGSMVVIKGSKRDGLYHLIGKTLTRKTVVATAPEDKNIILWHRRLGHISERGLQIMS